MKRILAYLFRPSRTHYRAAGPVTINPDRREIVHVRGPITNQAAFDAMARRHRGDNT